MNTSQMLEKIRDILKADAAIEAWSQELFLENITIYLGVDELSGPDESDYPVIVISGLRIIRGNSASTKIYEVDIGCGIVQEEIETDPLKSVKTFKGLLQAEDLRELVEASIIEEKFAKVSIEGETASLNFYPLFASFTTLKIELINKRRRL